MRCALFGPTPGSRPSSSMRLCTIPSYTGASPPSEIVAARLAAVRLAGGGAHTRDRGDAARAWCAWPAWYSGAWGAGACAGAGAAERADAGRERAHLLRLQV